MIVKAGQGGYNQLLEGVRLKNLVLGERMHLTKVTLDQGAVIPEHQHPQEQTGYMLSGKLRFFGQGGETIVTPGDCWTFASGETHGAEALEDSVVLELFSPLREDYLSLDN
jgi:quercetin dioxygenase-like cupin family protein